MGNNLILNIDLLGYAFYDSFWLWFLILIPILIYLSYRRLTKSSGVYKFSKTVEELDKQSFKPMSLIIFGTYATMGLGLCLLILAMAKPYLPNNNQEENYGEGIDIMLAIDVSGSMKATDFLPNRLEAAKEVAKDFISHRKSDRIGLVIFEGEAFTACPPTQDYNYLEHTIDGINSGTMKQGTAIGTGLGTAVAQIYDDTIPSKVVILLTDGVNNSGQISPEEAAQLAKAKKITVYTIGVGKRGYVETPINTPFGQIMQRSQVNIDEGLLKNIAKMTGGKYFRAVNKDSLRQIYQKINKLEKSKIITETVSSEPPFSPNRFLLYGLILTFIGLLFHQFILNDHA